MKKLLSLSLVLGLLISALPGAVLAADTLKVSRAEEFRFPQDNAPQTAFTVENTNDYDVQVKIEVFDQLERITVQSMTYTILKGDAPLPVPAQIYQTMTKNGEVRTYRYKITTPGGFVKYIHVAQKLTIEKDSNNVEIFHYDQLRNTYYPNNTVSSFGPHFRDVTPELTDLWYMFTPIDLSIQGRQTFELVASNIYQVGEVYVDVYQDTVVVSYKMFYDHHGYYSTERLSDYLNFYNSYADVGIVEPEDMPQPNTMFAFDQPFSILNHLGGDTNVLMFVRNRISYYRFPSPKAEYKRFWENTPQNKERRELMLQFMDPIMTVEQSK